MMVRATYFASDVAYHKDKIDRGFDKLINVWELITMDILKELKHQLRAWFYKEKLDVQLVQLQIFLKMEKK